MQITRLSRAAVRGAAALGCGAALLAAAACDSFIEPDPQDILAPENFYKTSTDAIAAVNAVYEQNKWTHWLAYWFITDVATDDMIATANFGSDGINFARLARKVPHPTVDSKGNSVAPQF